MNTLDKEMYMRRAIQLAGNGIGFASPNPMVGAVIVAPDGKIIGEGWHRCCGQAHAEVNAVASVPKKLQPLLHESTMFVTLEPCSHYGKTPPCAELILKTGIPRVVVASVDPFEKVSGRGIEMLRKGGVDVETGLLDDENKTLNRRFFTAHSHRRPFVTLKWARSADGFMDWKRNCNHENPCCFSHRLTGLSTMRLRSLHDAVLTTCATALADKCRLNVRGGWNGRQPQAFVIDRHGCLEADAAVLNVPNRNTIVLGADKCATPAVLLESLYKEYGVTSVLVESGPCFLNALIESDLWDCAREEVSPVIIGDEGVKRAPELADNLIIRSEKWHDNTIKWFENHC